MIKVGKLLIKVVEAYPNPYFVLISINHLNSAR